ncbi:hypothetical protein D3Z33_03550 [Senegalia massiliensis]|uniref:Uncharacterized protein n=1 Tax=Senegalia massiliensis TaxID=1720316 RepID=A0A845QUL3_9CLOT|nr:hypothetical protein [Senegalia massiliensis]
MKGIVEGAEKLGLESKAIRVDREAFISKFTLPTIAHIITDSIKYNILYYHFYSIIIYQYLNYIKLNLFYKDNKLANKVYFRDGILLTIGLSILYVSEAIIYINMSEFNIKSFIFSALFILPSILTNKMISKEFHTVNKDILENKR